MGFKADDSFLRFLSMGAVAVRQTMDNLHTKGFEPIELERHCTTNKIWATKVKRLRLPDLLCVKTGLRVEVRAKSDLKIRMSDAPNNPARVWDAGLRNEDLVAFVACFNRDDGPKAADYPVFLSVKALRDSVTLSTLGPPKSASEGAERDRTWPAIIPSRDGKVLTATAEKTNRGNECRQRSPSAEANVHTAGKKKLYICWRQFHREHLHPRGRSTLACRSSVASATKL